MDRINMLSMTRKPKINDFFSNRQEFMKQEKEVKVKPDDLTPKESKAWDKKQNKERADTLFKFVSEVKEDKNKYKPEDLIELIKEITLSNENENNLLAGFKF